jgi:hypothetical protein
MTIFLKMIPMIASMVNNVTKFLIGNTYNHICVIQSRHITKNNIIERADGKSKGTTLGHHHTRTILMNPTQVVGCQMRGSREHQLLHQIMSNQILLATIVEDEHGQGLLDLAIVSEKKLDEEFLELVVMIRRDGVQCCRILQGDQLRGRCIFEEES